MLTGANLGWYPVGKSLCCHKTQLPGLWSPSPFTLLWPESWLGVSWLFHQPVGSVCILNAATTPVWTKDNSQQLSMMKHKL